MVFITTVWTMNRWIAGLAKGKQAELPEQFVEDARKQGQAKATMSMAVQDALVDNVERECGKGVKSR